MTVITCPHCGEVIHCEEEEPQGSDAGGPWFGVSLASSLRHLPAEDTAITVEEKVFLSNAGAEWGFGE